ncbi:mucin-2-like [Saccostrea echinata]|uniref:mucin-2-like n=1 Tax=Saccostrea echinata TaxID=191078 RepID=UPI002A7ED857|nr:mucin-2-like [Saccostrea echinata]
MHDYQVIVLIGLLSIGLCLECHVCYFATDPTLCRHHVTCSSGQRCRNVVQTPESVGVFGRRRAVSDVECCHTDLCNRDTSHTAEQRSTTESPGNLSTELLTTVTIPPSTASEVQTSTSDNCSDHPDCDILTQGFNACNDSDIALIVCRRSCGMCDVTTTTPLCSDAHPDCQILSDHLNVCENNNFARTRCPWTCGLCDSSPSSTIFSTVSPTTEQKSGACEDGHDCELLKELNICENPLTAQLCPVYCGICLNYTQNSTISTPFSQTTTTNISTTLTSLGETTIETTESTTAQTTTQPTEHTATQTTGLTTEVTSTTSTMTTTEGSNVILRIGNKTLKIKINVVFMKVIDSQEGNLHA